MQNAFIAYETGDYPKALKLFFSMVVMNPWDESLWHAIAATKKMLRNYQEAIEAWELCAQLNSQNPLPRYHQAECYLAQNQIQKALDALNNAIEKPCTENLIAKIELMKEIIRHDSHCANSL
jgi:type III secretion system low calcium response chaperone LcrH/SycD